MKKILALIIAALLLVSCFGLTVGATAMEEDMEVPFEEYKYCELPQDKNITFSDDFKTLYVGEVAYSRFNSNEMYLEMGYRIGNLVIYDDNVVDNIDLTANEKGNAINAAIYYSDGSMLECSFMDNRYLEECNQIIEYGKNELFIDFMLGEEQYLKVEAQKLKAQQIKLKTEDFYYSSEDFEVLASVSDESININVGNIYIISDTVYYADFNENKDKTYDEGQIWNLYKIQDRKLIEEIKAKQKQYYEESEYGLFMDEEISKVISKVFFWIFFIILPFAVMVVSVIFALRSKKRMYKRMFVTTAVLAAAETVIFVIANFILFT